MKDAGDLYYTSFQPIEDHMRSDRTFPENLVRRVEQLSDIRALSDQLDRGPKVSEIGRRAPYAPLITGVAPDVVEVAPGIV
jgi:hypothetical protein